MPRKPSIGCPCCGQKLPSKVYLVDDKFRVVIRDGKGLQLSFVQFAIFRALYRRGHGLPLTDILTEVYRGGDAPLTARTSLHVAIRCMNQLISHLGLRIAASHSGPGAIWRIQQL